MPDSYDPRAVESAAQHFWNTTRAFEVTEDSSKTPFYCLSMLPYPSGALHMGHVRNYTIGDVISRFQRMQGRNVLQPMGWDAFGLPAENAAIKHKTAPAKWTWANIENMRGQFRAMGFAYDWSREFATCQPDYYVHEQRMFLRLFRKGLAYRKNAVVNWDPVDQTVLANEQVIDGRGWRTGAVVQKREVPQWFLKITDYAQELLDDLDALPGWPDAVKTMQRHWLGRSEGLEIRFDVEGDAPLTVFTTRPDTLMGVTYMAIAAEHPLALKAARDNPELADFLESCRSGGVSEETIETQEKSGLPTGLYAIHPVTGERLPIWAANFVLMSYGTGAVMCVPGHDKRDREFAARYDLPVKMVVVDGGVMDAISTLDREVASGALSNPMSTALHGGGSYAYDASAAVRVIEEFRNRIRDVEAWTEHGTLVNSGPFDGMNFDEAFTAVADYLAQNGKGERKVNWRLRDWGVSRQRYWGCPIPIIYCDDCGAVPVPDDQLPVVLPVDVAFSGVKSPIKADPQWRKTTCPQCGKPAERETDTFDTFMESSWYYARYTCPGASQQVDARANYWLPVDQYVGGIEHAILHLLYFRFYHKLLRDEGLLDSDEPVRNLLCQGMVIAETFYRDKSDGSRDWFNPSEVDVMRDERGRVTGAILHADGKRVEIGSVEKMSKSKNNGVDPQSMIDKYGADTVRLFSMFAAPPDQSLEWSEAGVEGMSRFLRRFWRAVMAHAAERPPASAGNNPTPTDAQRTLRRQLHETIAKVSDDYGRRHNFNTAIAALMELLNHVSKFDDASAQGHAVCHEVLEAMVLMLNPVTPHVCHALWQALDHAETLLEDIPWPHVDEAALVRDAVTLAVQVNGKLRGTIEVPASASRDDAERIARELPAIQPFIDGHTVRKVIVVPGKIVNIVV